MSIRSVTSSSSSHPSSPLIGQLKPMKIRCEHTQITLRERERHITHHTQIHMIQTHEKGNVIPRLDVSLEYVLAPSLSSSDPNSCNFFESYLWGEG